MKHLIVLLGIFISAQSFALSNASILKDRASLDEKTYADIYNAHFVKAPFLYKDVKKEMEGYLKGLKTKEGVSFFIVGKVKDPSAYSYAFKLSELAKDYPQLAKLIQTEKLDADNILVFETVLNNNAGSADFLALYKAIKTFAKQAGFKTVAYTTVVEDNFEHKALQEVGFLKFKNGVSFAMKWQTLQKDGSVHDDDHSSVLYLNSLK